MIDLYSPWLDGRRHGLAHPSCYRPVPCVLFHELVFGQWKNSAISTAMLAMFLKNSFLDQTNLLWNGARFEKPTVILNPSFNCPPLCHPSVVNSCDDFFWTVTKSRRSSRLLWTNSNHHWLFSRRGYHYFMMFQFGFWTEHCLGIYL
jgi:hypothetical protein